ncbi:hypothetical protein HGRIS_010359 [Hohenbuehelia grisea]|uniref:Protein-tyrosine-phosphatase n=1 Tax=Hohenbuehelia grisea TaxID=104357 RepID=A0ABR3J437_9AGAR
MSLNPPSINYVIKDRLYIGNLTAAQSADSLSQNGITHILSVCPDYPSTSTNHLTIPVLDSEYENILIHLPKACDFIQHVLDQGGRVLVHCLMGISRSTAVVCAYRELYPLFRPQRSLSGSVRPFTVMRTRHMSPSAAVRFVKRCRPRAYPNYGFLRQLHAFADCQYDPTPANKTYISWKRSHDRRVTGFLQNVLDTATVIPDQLYLSSEFPTDVEEAEWLLLELGVTHVLSVSPGDISVPSSILPGIKHHHIEVGSAKDSLLIAMPDACRFIRHALKSAGVVLVYSSVESRACAFVCAYFMSYLRLSPKQALSRLENALPLFNATSSFTRNLTLFETCEYAPTSNHPCILKEWGIPSNITGTRSVTNKADMLDMNTNAVALSAAAASLLSETGFDMTAFGDALAHIQKTRSVAA